MAAGSAGADIATLGIKVDASGAVTTTNQVRGSLDRLGVSGTQVQRKMQGLATVTANSLGSMASSANRDITGIMRSMSQLGFAFGGTVGAITLAITSIANAMVETSRATREESRRMADELMKDARRLQDHQKEGLEIRLGLLQRERDAIMQQINVQGKGIAPGSQGTTGIGMLDRLLDAIARNPLVSDDALAKIAVYDKEIRDVVDALRLLEKAQEKANAKLEESEAKKFADHWRLLREQSDAAVASQKALNDGVANYAKRLAEADDEAKKLYEFTLSNIGDFGWDEKANAAIDETIRKLKIVLEEMKKQEEQAKRNKEIIQGALLGIGVGVLQRTGPVGSAIGGAVSAGIGAAAMGAGGWAIAAVAAEKLVSSLFDFADAAKAAREQQRLLTLAYEQFTDTIKTQLGDMSASEKAIRDVRREFDEMRRQMGLGAEEFKRIQEAVYLHPDDKTRTLADMQRELDKINELERRRIEQLQEEARALQEAEARRQLEMQQDLQVRLLRAIGHDEEAEALAFALAQQREYAQAVRDGADATTLAALAEVQRYEKIGRAMQLIQARIDSFTATITGLQDFQSALKLGDASLSPTARLAEANRQYQEVLDLAMGGDQAAAGRLPASAQALLDASRAVNASGPAFQEDFLRVIADTQAAIEKFTDLRSIEELMLDELKAIRGNTEPRPLGDVNIIPITRVPIDEPVVDLEPLITVTQEGLQALINRVEALTAQVGGLTTATRTGFDGLNLQRT